MGIVIADILLLFSCDFITLGHSVFGCGLMNVVFGPWWPIALLIKYFGLVFPSERILTIMSVAVWFIFGSVIGAFIGFMKNKKSPPK